MLKLVSFHIQAHLNAFLQTLEYFSQICLGPLATESPCIYRADFILFLISKKKNCLSLYSYAGPRFSARPDRPWGPPSLL